MTSPIQVTCIHDTLIFEKGKTYDFYPEIYSGTGLSDEPPISREYHYNTFPYDITFFDRPTAIAQKALKFVFEDYFAPVPNK